MNQDDCLFCRIVKGEIPSYKIYENDSTFAFLDINPISNGHVLVVPKNHSDNITKISKEEFSSLMESVRLISLKLKESLDSDSINIKMIGEIVNHTHVHIIPRYNGDNPVDGMLDESAKNNLKDTLEKIIDKI